MVLETSEPSLNEFPSNITENGSVVATLELNKKVIKELSLKNITAVNTRISPTDDSLKLKGQFDVVTIRAVTSAPNILKNFAFLLNENGYILAWKGTKDLPELNHPIIQQTVGYSVHHVPEHLQDFSVKFSDMRVIKFWMK